jgi:hypothetical protein
LGGLSSIGGGPEAADWQRDDDGWIRIEKKRKIKKSLVAF